MIIIPYSDDSPRYRMQYVTFGLIAVNLVIHFYVSTRDPADIVEIWLGYASLGASYNPLRSISAAFLHADWWHVLGNMWFLFLFGSAVEGKLGYRWMVGLYIACALLSDLAQHFLSPVDYRLALGASGAVGGLAGAFWFLFSKARVNFFYWIFVYIGSVEISVNWAMLYIFGWDVLMFVTETSTGVGHSAHLGGLLGGLACGLALRHSGYITLDGEDMLSRFVIWKGRRKRYANSFSTPQDDAPTPKPVPESPTQSTQPLAYDPDEKIPYPDHPDEPNVLPFDD